MSDSLLSVILILAELGAALFIVLVVAVVFYLLGSKKEAKGTRSLVEYVKAVIPKHRDQLEEYFKDEIDKKKSDYNIETLIKDERKIYDRLIKVSITKDISMLKPTTADINSLINDYVRLLTLKVEVEADKEKESTAVILKKENEALRLENASLTNRLDQSNETIENMMGEFSSMYEGGKKEGQQRLKNEMYQLKQSLNGEEAKVKAELSKLEKEEKNEDEEK